MKEEFKIGDLVRIRETTHSPKIPENRLGLLVKMTDDSRHMWLVLMTNNNSLRFHEMFLDRSLESNKDEKAE
jgi:hypothetical protein